MAKCMLFGESFTIPDSYIRNFVMNKRSCQYAEAAEKEFNAWYEKRLGIDAVMKGYEDIVIDLMDKYAIAPLRKQLEALGIYDISREMYVNQVVDYSAVINAEGYIESDIEEIDEDKNEKKQYRAARKASRSRFVGGGFGMSGAIKGSMEAGALNAATGMLHGSVNVVGNIGSAVGASFKKAALYNEETRETLERGLSEAIGKTYINHKQLVNAHIRDYFVDGFDPVKSAALFENAKKLPAKREELLFQAVQYCPMERVLSYIFINYPNEKANVYQIGKLFEIDFGKYVEESFAKSYTADAQRDPAKAEAVKANIINEMKIYGIKTSATLTQINRDMLFRIIARRQFLPEDGVNEQVIKEYREYDAPKTLKKELVAKYGFWELAKEYGVEYPAEAAEKILEKFYSDKAKSDESEALKVKKKLKKLMKELSVSDSATYNQIEKDCIRRLCGDIESADEARCKEIKQKITEYSALQKNKQEFLDAVQARIEAIWAKEDGEIFDNLYMETDIYDQNKIQEAIKFIKEKGRTSGAEKYITALESCTPENIKKAKKYRDKNAKNLNTLGIVLLILGVAGGFILMPLTVLVVPGIILMVSYRQKKKMWKILTIDETQIHSMLLTESESTTSKTVPSEATTSESTALEVATSETAVSEIVASETVPSEAAASEVVPSETAASETVPSETAPSETAPSETATSETVASESTTSETAASETATSKTVPSEATTSESPISETVPSETVASETTISETVLSETVTSTAKTENNDIEIKEFSPDTANNSEKKAENISSTEKDKSEKKRLQQEEKQQRAEEKKAQKEECKKLNAANDTGVGNTIYKVVFWCLSLLYWFMAFALISSSEFMISGICLAITGVLINPQVRKFVVKKGHKVQKWILPIIAIVGFFIAMMLA